MARPSRRDHQVSVGHRFGHLHVLEVAPGQRYLAKRLWKNGSTLEPPAKTEVPYLSAHSVTHRCLLPLGLRHHGALVRGRRRIAGG